MGENRRSKRCKYQWEERLVVSEILLLEADEQFGRCIEFEKKLTFLGLQQGEASFSRRRRALHQPISTRGLQQNILADHVEWDDLLAE